MSEVINFLRKHDGSEYERNKQGRIIFRNKEGDVALTLSEADEHWLAQAKPRPLNAVEEIAHRAWLRNVLDFSLVDK